MKSKKNLIKQLVITDLKMRYQNSVLGYVWTLLKPLFMFGVLFVVFTQIFKVGKAVPYFAAYLLLGLVVWTFFVEATVSGMHSILQRGDMIRKITISKFAIVLSANISALINFLFNLCVVIAAMVLLSVPLRWEMLFMLPLIALLFVTTLGISLLLSTLFVKFRDMSHVWDVVVQTLFYATPILYTLDIVPRNIQLVQFLSPVTNIIQFMRWSFITPDTPTIANVSTSPAYYLLVILVFVITILSGVLYFKKHSKYFAEEI